jgi:hypothetical protein
MNIDIISSFPDPLDKPCLDFLIELYDKEDNLLWIEVCSKISENQLDQVLAEVSKRDEKKWTDEYNAMSEEDKDMQYRTSALYYARDHNYFTLEDEFAMVNKIGAFTESGINYVSEVSDPELYGRLVMNDFFHIMIKILSWRLVILVQSRLVVLYLIHFHTMSHLRKHVFLEIGR